MLVRNTSAIVKSKIYSWKRRFKQVHPWNCTKLSWDLLLYSTLKLNIFIRLKFFYTVRRTTFLTLKNSADNIKMQDHLQTQNNLPKLWLVLFHYIYALPLQKLFLKKLRVAQSTLFIFEMLAFLNVQKKIKILLPNRSFSCSKAATISYISHGLPYKEAAR